AWSKNRVGKAFGKDGLTLHKWANGQDGRMVQAYNLAPFEKETYAFDEAVDSRASLDTALEVMIYGLAQRLERRAASTQQITLHFQLENKKLLERVLDLRKPLVTGDQLWRAIQRAVDQLHFEAGVVGVEILLELLLPDL